MPTPALFPNPPLEIFVSMVNLEAGSGALRPRYYAFELEMNTDYQLVAKLSFLPNPALYRPFEVRLTGVERPQTQLKLSTYREFQEFNISRIGPPSYLALGELEEGLYICFVPLVETRSDLTAAQILAAAEQDLDPKLNEDETFRCTFENVLQDYHVLLLGFAPDLPERYEEYTSLKSYMRERKNATDITSLFSAD